MIEGNLTNTTHGTVTTAGANGTYWPSITDGYIYTYPQIILGERRGPMEQRGLYQIIVVNPKDEEILADQRVVASNEANARIKALRRIVLNADPDDLDFIVTRLGNVRAKRSLQEVKIVEN